MKPPLQEQRTQQMASGDGWQSAGLGATVSLGMHSSVHTAGRPQLEELQVQERGKGFLFQQYDLLNL